MRPAWSVVLFTTLAGVGQGLVLALFCAEWASGRHWLAAAVDGDAGFYAGGALLAAALSIAGLVASFFHLGRPERAWRAASQWRTSWLSREVIVLPAFIALTLAWAAAHQLGHELRFAIGLLASLTALLLWVCTGMIYACLRFLREWATPLTPLNFTLMGLASGFTLAAALAAVGAPELLRFFVSGALALTLAAFAGRLASWQRNATLAPKSTLQTAIGIKHGRIEQRSMGFMGGAFNTREFFHGKGPEVLRALKLLAVAGVFAVPIALLVIVVALGATPSIASSALLLLAVPVQYAGLLAERWLFFAEARHPQNLYYQRMA